MGRVRSDNKDLFYRSERKAGMFRSLLADYIENLPFKIYDLGSINKCHKWKMIKVLLVKFMMSYEKHTLTSVKCMAYKRVPTLAWQQLKGIHRLPWRKICTWWLRGILKPSEGRERREAWWGNQDTIGLFIIRCGCRAWRNDMGSWLISREMIWRIFNL